MVLAGLVFQELGPDYALRSVSYVNGNPSQGALVHVKNKGWLPLPVTMAITWIDGSSARVLIPTETWYQKNDVTLQIPGKQAIQSVVLDPDHKIPDLNRTDNAFVVKTDIAHKDAASAAAMSVTSPDQQH